MLLCLVNLAEGLSQPVCCDSRLVDVEPAEQRRVDLSSNLVHGVDVEPDDVSKQVHGSGQAFGAHCEFSSGLCQLVVEPGTVGVQPGEALANLVLWQTLLGQVDQALFSRV